MLDGALDEAVLVLAGHEVGYSEGVARLHSSNGLEISLLKSSGRVIRVPHAERLRSSLAHASGSRSPIRGPTVVTSGHGSMASGVGSTPARSAAIRSK